jgi:hypothetical protein
MTHSRAIRQAAVRCFTGVGPLNTRVRRDKDSRRGWKRNLLDALSESPLIGTNPSIPTLMPRGLRPTIRGPPGFREEEIFVHPLNIGQSADENTRLLADSAASPRRHRASSAERDPLPDSIYHSCLDVYCPVSRTLLLASNRASELERFLSPAMKTRGVAM